MCLLGPDHHEVAVNCNNLAAVLERRGPLVEAEALYQRALGAKERTLGPDHPALALTLNNLAVNHRRQGHHREAEAPLKRALKTLDGKVQPSNSSEAPRSRQSKRFA